MPGLPFFSQVLSSQVAAGAALGTFTTAKSVINATEIVQIPPNYLRVGSKLRIRALGGLTTLVTTPGTVSFQVMLGPTSTIIAFTTGAIQMNATAHTLLPWDLDVMLRVDTVGSGTTAKILGMGNIRGVAFTRTAGQVDDVNTPGAFATPATAPAVGTGFDSTVTNLLDFWVGFSISSASNVVQVYDYTVEQLQG